MRHDDCPEDLVFIRETVFEAKTVDGTNGDWHLMLQPHSTKYVARCPVHDFVLVADDPRELSERLKAMEVTR